MGETSSLRIKGWLRICCQVRVRLGGQRGLQAPAWTIGWLREAVEGRGLSLLYLSRSGWPLGSKREGVHKTCQGAAFTTKMGYLLGPMSLYTVSEGCAG